MTDSESKFSTHDFFNKTVRYFVYCLHPSSNFVFFVHDTENVEFIKFLDIQS